MRKLSFMVCVIGLGIAYLIRAPDVRQNLLVAMAGAIQRFSGDHSQASRGTAAHAAKTARVAEASTADHSRATAAGPKDPWQVLRDTGAFPRNDGKTDGEGSTVAATTVAASSTTPAVATEREEEVLALYGDLAAAFDKHASDCNELASALDGLVDANKSALEQLANERASMTPEQRMLADQRVERAAGPELDRFRKTLRSGVMRCPTHERLHAALAKLAELGQPS